MIRVCHVITGLAAHGAEGMLLRLVSSMDRQRYECTVISLMDEGVVGSRLEALGIRLFTVGLPRGRPTLAGLIRFIRQVREVRPHVLQGWMYHGNLAATLAYFTLPGKPALYWNIRQSLYDIAHEKRLTRWMIRLSARCSGIADGLIYNSLASAVQHERLGFRSGKRIFIPNGFDGSFFVSAQDEGNSLRKELGIGKDAVLIGMAARFHPMKDHENFLQAAARIASRHSGAYFVLAGHGVDSGNKNLRIRADEPDLRDRVHFLGERRDMQRFYRALDIAVLSSAWGEGFPNVLGEAMACGVPCVATDVGDSRAILDSTGKIVPPRDPEALAEAVSELIKLGRNGRIQLGVQARQRIMAHYALDRIVAAYESLYAGIRPDSDES